MPIRWWPIIWTNNGLANWRINVTLCLDGLRSYQQILSLYMMTSSNGDILCVTVPLWGEYTGHRWIPLTKASGAELWYFLWSAPEQTVDQSIETPVIWDVIALIITSLAVINVGFYAWGVRSLHAVESQMSGRFTGAEWRIYVSVNQQSLVQMMACRLTGAKPLSEPMLEYC